MISPRISIISDSDVEPVEISSESPSKSSKSSTGTAAEFKLHQKPEVKLAPMKRLKKKCANFLDLKNVCEEFLGELFESGTKKAETILLFGRQFCSELSSQESSLSSSDSSVEITPDSHRHTFSGWPKIEQFTIELGHQKLEEFMDFWIYEEDWVFDVEIIGSWSDKVQDYYLYESVWSIPTKEYPVAQATASIFFTYEVSRIKPKCCIVEIYYSFEGQVTKFTPTKVTSLEKCLFSIINAKLKFFESLRF